ncbi:hypothetical protein LAM24_20985, partial [Mycobacterium tuberculosis]|nr:hypothetical protein [Mycobacterium tuberculosis]
LTFDGFSYAQRYCIFIHNKCMNIDTITTQGVSTMKNNLPPFIEIYRALIATPSISATEEALDQSNESLINLLAGWFRDLGFNVEVQPVPDTRHKFNLLASTGHGAGGLLLGAGGAGGGGGPGRPGNGAAGGAAHGAVGRGRCGW